MGGGVVVVGVAVRSVSQRESTARPFDLKLAAMMHAIALRHTCLP
jgi:hypothetical protein